MGRGEAARLEVSGPDALTEAAQWCGPPPLPSTSTATSNHLGSGLGAVREHRVRPGRRDVGLRRPRGCPVDGGTGVGWITTIGDSRPARRPDDRSSRTTRPASASATPDPALAPGELVRRRRHRRPATGAAQPPKVAPARDLLVLGPTRARPLPLCSGAGGPLPRLPPSMAARCHPEMPRKAAAPGARGARRYGTPRCRSRRPAPRRRAHGLGEGPRRARARRRTRPRRRPSCARLGTRPRARAAHAGQRGATRPPTSPPSAAGDRAARRGCSS